MTDSDRDIDALRALVGTDRDRDGTAFATLAHALLEAGRPTDAHDVVEAGRAHHPEFATGHLVAGLVDLALAAREPARAAFRRVLQLDPDNRVALRAIAQLYEEEGEPSQALAYLMPLAQIEPEDITLHERIVRLEASREAGAVASELPPDPEHPTQPDPGALLFPDELGDPVADELAANSSLEEVVDVSGPGEPSMEELADDALAWVQQRGRDAVPGAAEAEVVTRTMAEVLTRQGQFGEAIEMYDRLVEQDPDNASLHDARAAVVAQMEAAGARSVDPEPPVARPSGAAAPEVRDYFEELLAAQGDTPVLGPDLLSDTDPTGPDAIGAVADGITADLAAPTAVPIAELGPEPEAVETLSPGIDPGVDVDGPVGVESLAPDAAPVGSLAPDPVSIADLAPHSVPVAQLGPDPVPIADLAPDPRDVRNLAPGVTQPEPS